mmetsp:Transcript_24284/g.79122  ORF Transcript_24284/g.79122 Transcript_24284/m.79122 type:complete len:207 (-) Transcript_24284:469-1089(-)
MRRKRRRIGWKGPDATASGGRPSRKAVMALERASERGVRSEAYFGLSSTRQRRDSTAEPTWSRKISSDLAWCCSRSRCVRRTAPPGGRCRPSTGVTCRSGRHSASNMRSASRGNIVPSDVRPGGRRHAAAPSTPALASSAGCPSAASPSSGSSSRPWLGATDPRTVSTMRHQFSSRIEKPRKRTCCVRSKPCSTPWLAACSREKLA